MERRAGAGPDAAEGCTPARAARLRRRCSRGMLPPTPQPACPPPKHTPHRQRSAAARGSAGGETRQQEEAQTRLWEVLLQPLPGGLLNAVLPRGHHHQVTACSQPQQRLVRTCRRKGRRVGGWVSCCCGSGSVRLLLWVQVRQLVWVMHVWAGSRQAGGRAPAAVQGCAGQAAGPHGSPLSHVRAPSPATVLCWRVPATPARHLPLGVGEGGRALAGPPAGAHPVSPRCPPQSGGS